MRSTMILLITAALAACQVAPPDAPAPETAPGAAAPAPTSGPEATRVVSLEGEWRVAGIDGAELNAPYGIELTGSAQELWWEPRCARVARSYRIDGLAVSFGPPLGSPPASANAPPPPVCAIGLPPRMGDVTRALDAATTIGRTASNGIEISGGGHSLVLFSQ